MELRKLAIILGFGLFFSLLANMFMAGLLMGRTAAPDKERVSSAWVEKDQELRQNLSAEDRAAVKKAMEGTRGRFQALRQELQAAQENVQQAMNAEPFDQAALDAALRIEKEKKMEMLQQMRLARQSAMQNLSPEGQKALQRFGRGGEGRGERQRPFMRNRPQQNEKMPDPGQTP